MLIVLGHTSVSYREDSFIQMSSNDQVHTPYIHILGPLIAQGDVCAPMSLVLCT